MRIKDFRCMSENLVRKSHWNQGGEKEYLVFWYTLDKLITWKEIWILTKLMKYLSRQNVIFSEMFWQEMNFLKIFCN